MKFACALCLVLGAATNAVARPPRPPPGIGDPLSRIEPSQPSPVSSSGTPDPMTVEAVIADANKGVASQLPSFPTKQPGVTVPRPEGCSPGCGANEICAKLGDSYCRMGDACSVCIKWTIVPLPVNNQQGMDSIRIPTPALAAIFANQKPMTPSPTSSAESTISPFDVDFGTVGLTGGNKGKANKGSDLLSMLGQMRQTSEASQHPSDIQMEKYLQMLATADSSMGTLSAVDSSTASGSSLNQPNIVDYNAMLQFQQTIQMPNNTNGTLDFQNGNVHDLWVQFNNFVKQKDQPGAGATGVGTSGVDPLGLNVNTQSYLPPQQPPVNNDPLFGDLFGTSSTNTVFPMWPMFDMPLLGLGFF